MISSLKQFFIWLKSEDYRSDNIFSKIQTPKSNISLPSIISENDIKITKNRVDEIINNFNLLQN